SRTTIGDFIDEMARLLHCPPPQKTLPLAVPRAACVVFELLRRLGVRKKAGPINRAGLRFLGTSRWVDILRARTELDFFPQIQFREGLAETLVRAKEDADERTEFAHTSR